jgi:hypothetical protein
VHSPAGRTGQPIGHPAKILAGSQKPQWRLIFQQGW